MTRLPVSVSPVKPILRTVGLRISSSPTTEPGPTTTFKTPGGSPASFISSTSLMDDNGVVLAGLATTVVPVASAGAILLASRVRGKFQGTIAPTTPSGRRTTIPNAPGTESGTYCPRTALEDVRQA